MGFYGRHRVYTVFWTWSIGPFLCTTDIMQASGSKSVGGSGRSKLVLYPRPVPRVVRSRGQRRGVVQRSDQGYMDVLRPNDWVFIWVDPFDGEQPEPLFVGFIDDVRLAWTLDATGTRQLAIHVSCSSWEKAIENTNCISNLWVSENINIGNLYDLALRASDNQYTPLVPAAVAAIMETFLDAESREEFLQRQQDQYREELARAEVDRLVAELTGVEEDSPQGDPIQINDNPAMQGNEDPVQTIMGQFELPGTRVPLWRLIRLRFEDLRQRVFTIPQSMVNNLGSPLSRFVDEWSNSTINEIIYDVRRISADGTAHLERGGRQLSQEAVQNEGRLKTAMGDVISAANEVSDAVGLLFNDIAPYAILMERPLMLDEIEDLEGPTLDASELTNMGLGFSDSDHYNMSWLEAPQIDANQQMAASGLTGFDFARTRAIEMVRRHGLRIYTDQVQGWPDTSDANNPTGVPNPDTRELLRDWNRRIQIAGLDQVELLTGDITIPKYVRGAYIGGKLRLSIPPEPGVFADGAMRVFYLEGIDWSYQAQNGHFEYTMALTRGYQSQSPGVPII